MTEKDKVMVTVTLGYSTYCMPLDDAVALAKALSNAEMYENKYRSTSEGGSTHHIYPNDEKVSFQINLISADLYRMAKLAGKPT